MKSVPISTWHPAAGRNNDGMLIRLLFLFTVVPFVELVILLQVHHAISSVWGNGIGLLVTLGGIVVTGILGATLARQQGLGVIRQVRGQMGRGEVPGQALADGILVLFGAALLLTPGFLSDIFGFSLLIPASRSFYRTRMMRWFKGNVQIHRAGFSSGSGAGTQPEVFVVDPVESKLTDDRPS